MSPDELAASARERLDAAIGAGRLTPRPSPEAIRLIADALLSYPVHPGADLLIARPDRGEPE